MMMASAVITQQSPSSTSPRPGKKRKMSYTLVRCPSTYISKLKDIILYSVLDISIEQKSLSPEFPDQHTNLASKVAKKALYQLFKANLGTFTLFSLDVCNLMLQFHFKWPFQQA